MFYRRAFTCSARHTLHGRCSSSARSMMRVRSPEVTNLRDTRSYLERYNGNPVIGRFSGSFTINQVVFLKQHMHIRLNVQQLVYFILRLCFAKICFFSNKFPLLR